MKRLTPDASGDEISAHGAVRTDTERLDWLGERFTFISTASTNGDAGDDAKVFRAPTLREAINKAMDEQDDSP